MNGFASTIVLLAVTAFAPPVLAHGDDAHHLGQEGPSGEAAEQMPFGRAGDPAHVQRTVAVAMTDAMRYEPAEIRVKQGETLRIVATNQGRVRHEIVIGTLDELKEHAALMRRFPGMEHHEPNMAHVPPGKREDLVWEFNRLGEFYFACLVPGHFEAGMVGKIIVSGVHASPRAAK